MNNFYTQESKFEPLKGFEDEYLINREGTIVSKLTDMTLVRHTDTKGYLYVDLYKDGVHHRLRVHVLMAKQYLPNPNNCPVVNHINGNKKDDRIENLEWVTYSENTLHAYKTGLQSQDKNKVKIIRDDGVEYSSITEAAVANGVSKYAISKALHGALKTAGGHTWREKKEQQ